MSDGMGREFMYLSSHATNRYFIPNWGNTCRAENCFRSCVLWWSRKFIDFLLQSLNCAVDGFQ